MRPAGAWELGGARGRLQEWTRAWLEAWPGRARGARRHLAGPRRWDAAVWSGSRSRSTSGPAGLAGVLPLALDDWCAAVAARGRGLLAVLTCGCCGRIGAGLGARGGVPILVGTPEEAPGL
ncbi:hypothetical protein NDU88_011175 [Pleurodeles waltl]|uniref:Uncharacterized protein n=1 Tax=Pleurodeles waltl TaxID=8319 RepID=A0AAV7R0N6_PLEWA|nr:hypothetical protein NDU88_011175 [Pleurodeles waltl]